MTEAEWLTSSDAEKTVRFLDPIRYSRQLLLFYAAYCARLPHLLVQEETKLALDFLPRHADRLFPPEHWSEVHALATHGSRAMTPTLPYSEVLAAHRALEFAADAVMSITTACHPANDAERRSDYHYAAVDDLACSVSYSKVPPDTLANSLGRVVPDPAEYAEQIRLLHEIVGNPFRPVTFAPSWRTSDALPLAQSMYDSRDFSAMPILADALQDAGCDNTDILNHCRDPHATHVRGCWVVDLVLGKS